MFRQTKSSSYQAMLIAQQQSTRQSSITDRSKQQAGNNIKILEKNNENSEILKENLTKSVKPEMPETLTSLHASPLFS